MLKISLRYLILLVPITSTFASNAKWQDFENNMYLGGSYLFNSAKISQFGTSSTNSGALDLGATALFNNRIYLNLDGNANFNSGGSFVGNWYNLTFKTGYSLQTDNFNFIPYALLGYGNEGAYYSNSTSTNYGLGLLSEYMITADWLLYTDVNYQLQSFNDSINSDFNQNVLNNYANYNIAGTPYTYGVNIGVKYITKNGFYFNPFFNYQYYQQNFDVTGGPINFGTLNPSVSQYQFGIKFGLVI